MTDANLTNPTLSVVIVAQNEERTIGNVIKAIQPIAGEVILVDSGSTDRTMTIAQELGAKVSHQDWLGYSGQKNFAIALATGDWILSLDADEVVTDELRDEIVETLSWDVPENVAGFKLPRVLFIGDTAVRRGGFYPDAQLRLVRQGKGRFRERIVHEAMEVDGDVLTLKHDLHHYSYATVEKFSEAMDKYARLSAQHYLSKDAGKWRRSPINELIHPFWTFFYRYIIRLGFLDTPLCLRLNLIYAGYVRKKIMYLRQLHAERGL
jgi:glycosyltransferase involved in cell wall biosynthesis